MLGKPQRNHSHESLTHTAASILPPPQTIHRRHLRFPLHTTHYRRPTHPAKLKLTVKCKTGTDLETKEEKGNQQIETGKKNKNVPQRGGGGGGASCKSKANNKKPTNLVRRLVQFLGVKGSAETEGEAGAKEDIVRQGSDTAVVDLGLMMKKM